MTVNNAYKIVKTVVMTIANLYVSKIHFVEDFVNLFVVMWFVGLVIIVVIMGSLMMDAVRIISVIIGIVKIALSLILYVLGFLKSCLLPYGSLLYCLSLLCSLSAWLYFGY